MSFRSLVKDIGKCKICEPNLPLGANPVFRANPAATILVAGQAPGIRVHETGIPFNDPSGDRLRQWMSIDSETFYGSEIVAIIPMGFCYPGTGKNGDLPPRPECAETWRHPLLQLLPNIRLILVIGQYAHKYHLGKARSKTLTETVRNWRSYGQSILPLPHPSPRNNIWLKKNPWFETDVIPELQKRVGKLV